MGTFFGHRAASNERRETTSEFCVFFLNSRVLRATVSERFLIDFRSFRKVWGCSKVPRLPAKSRVRPFVQRVDERRGAISQIDPEIDPDSYNAALEFPSILRPKMVEKRQKNEKKASKNRSGVSFRWNNAPRARFLCFRDAPGTVRELPWDPRKAPGEPFSPPSAPSGSFRMTSP